MLEKLGKEKIKRENSVGPKPTQPRLFIITKTPRAYLGGENTIANSFYHPLTVIFHLTPWTYSPLLSTVVGILEKNVVYYI